MLLIKCFEASVCLLLESYSLYFKHITKQLLQILDDRSSCTEAYSTVIVLSFVGEIFSRICRRGLSGTYAPSITLFNCPRISVIACSFSVICELPWGLLVVFIICPLQWGSWENVDLIFVTDRRMDVT